MQTTFIASKEWANRPKDHDALPELRALRDAFKARARAPGVERDHAVPLVPLDLRAWPKSGG
jgi:hypothetical protein